MGAIRMADGSIAHICSVSEPGRHQITVGGKVIYFTWSDMFGPLPETRAGVVRELHHNHPFWAAASAWGQRRRAMTEGK